MAAGVGTLDARGITVHRHPDDRELELFVVSTFGPTPAVGVVTFVSRGTDEDALIEAFALHAHLEWIEQDGEEVAIFTVATADRRRVPESRLHIALKAALNREVRIPFA